MLHDKNNNEGLDALRRQDQAAFAALVKKYHQRMVVIARAIAGDVWAEEVTQEAWVYIYRALPNFEGRSTLQTWMFTILKNEAKTRLTKESRFVSMDMRTVDSSSEDFAHSLNERFREDGQWKEAPTGWHIESPTALLEEEQLRQCIHHTLSLLSADQRAVFTLRDLQQLDLDEICNILDISASNVRVLLHRARMTLMRVIDRYQETGTC